MASVVTLTLGLLQFLGAHREVLVAIIAMLFIGLLRGNRERSLVNLPIVGMWPSLLLNLHHVHDWITRVVDGNCTFQFTGPWFSGMNYLFTADPENVKYVSSTNFKNFLKGSPLREMFDEFGDAVSTSESDEWRIRRRVTHDLMYQPEVLRSTRRVIHEKLENDLLPLLSHFAEGGGEMKVDLWEVLRRYTFDVACLLIFGVDVCSLSLTFPEVPVMKATDDLFEATFLRFTMPRSWCKFMKWLQMGSEKKLSESMEIIDDFIRKVMTKKKSEVSRGSDAHPGESDAMLDLLTCFIDHQMMDETGRFRSDKSVRDHTLELLTAGKDSTSLFLAWFFWVVATHPSVETRIVEEMTSTMQADGTRRRETGYVVFDAEVLNGCIYFNAAIQETLRLFPAVPITPRWALQRDVLPSGHKVEPGSVIFFSSYAMGRMGKIWGEDRLEFKPERWISNQGKLKEESSYKFPGFGSGPRMCLGKGLASSMVRAVAAAVIYNFHFEVAEGHQVYPRSNIVLHMKNGLVGHVRERCPR